MTGWPGPSGAARPRPASRRARLRLPLQQATTRARTRSRPIAYGGPSRRISSTIRRSAFGAIRQRYEPSDTVIGSVGSPIAPHSARRSTSAIRASCLSSAAAARVGCRGPGPGRAVVHGGLLDLDLAEGGQHRGDVVQERPVGPDDQHAGPPQPLPVQVEQVRGAVQADRGLAGAGRALHADRSSSSARTSSSCSGWMVATMSRIGPTRGRSISAVRIRLAVPSSSPRSRCSSSKLVSVARRSRTGGGPPRPAGRARWPGRTSGTPAPASRAPAARRPRR